MANTKVGQRTDSILITDALPSTQTKVLKVLLNLLRADLLEKPNASCNVISPHAPHPWRNPIIHARVLNFK